MTRTERQQLALHLPRGFLSQVVERAAVAPHLLTRVARANNGLELTAPQ